MKSAQSFRAPLLLPERWSLARCGSGSIFRGCSGIEHGKHASSNYSDLFERLGPVGSDLRFCHIGLRRELGYRRIGFRQQSVEVSRVDFPCLKTGTTENALEQRNIGLDACHEILGERSL